ncbi:hypothetical protein EIP91_010118 [Steccherinum ochraceum]|uniref:DUF1996 domain-containing protein n=1 Tax=Steccherinum ochraceum TaxID=92696 RepID=A0A4R0RW22_9APHY|nr:hypothetical protein EIP91_010118 [Steccherinum ochraceum]
MRFNFSTPTIDSLYVLSLAGFAHAWFRLQCTDPLVSERIDPIVSPGVVGSNHVHTVHGASNFNSTYDYDDIRASDCTSCMVTQDKSNYWFPKLYYMYPNGTFQAVGNGGLLVYYQNRGTQDVANGGPGLKAFPPGLKMITGDPTRRAKKFPAGQGSQDELAERAIQWTCLRYTVNQPQYDDNGTGFPTTDCEAGFQSRLHMPACWDGVNLDSSDHKSHTAFLSGLDNGDCPSSHPVGLMKLFFEVTWSVTDFAHLWNPGKDKWPFVWSTGDPTGFSWHGDFQTGWETSALQNAIDHCNNPNDATGQGDASACSFLTLQSASTANQCKVSSIVSEDVQGPMARLPGCNPIQSGPGDATLFGNDDCPASLSVSSDGLRRVASRNGALGLLASAAITFIV